MAIEELQEKYDNLKKELNNVEEQVINEFLEKHEIGQLFKDTESNSVWVLADNYFNFGRTSKDKKCFLQLGIGGRGNGSRDLSLDVQDMTLGFIGILNPINSITEEFNLTEKLLDENE